MFAIGGFDYCFRHEFQLFLAHWFAAHQLLKDQPNHLPFIVEFQKQFLREFLATILFGPELSTQCVGVLSRLLLLLPLHRLLVVLDHLLYGCILWVSLVRFYILN